MREMLIRMDQTLKVVEKDVSEIKIDQKSNYVTKESFNYHEDRIKKIEESIVWVVRIVIGMVIAAILGLVIITS